jgi:protein-S-isoprenylcysteine O-methyltransferase Ste14
MTLPLLVVFLSKFVIFAVLGLMFFRKAKPNLMWILTAMPFAINSALLIVCNLSPGFLPSVASTPPYEYVRAVAAALCVAAIALYMFTLGSHRVAIPGWHQPQDKPSQLVTWGPYQRIRHPFYSSYVLFFVASALVARAWPVLLNALYQLAIINFTAAREERDLSAHFGDDYERYCATTGRFVPRLSC